MGVVDAGSQVTRSDVDLMAQALRRLGLVPSSDPDALQVSWADREGKVNSLNGCLPQLHSDIFAEVSAARCVLRVASPAVESVVERCEGFPLLCQDGVCFYEGVAICESEAEVAKAIRGTTRGPCLVLVQGKAAYVVAGSPGDACVLAFNLDRCCQVQLLVGKRAVLQPDPKVAALALRQMEIPGFEVGVEWPAMSAWLRGEVPEVPKKEGEARPEEETLRKQLSQAHKEANRRGWDMLIWNHISAKLGDGMLITPGDRMWSQVEPESLKVSSSNVTADVLHAAVYNYTDRKAVVHLHTPAVMAVACLKEGLIVGEGSEFDGKVAYHDWEGFSDDYDECPRVGKAIAAINDCKAVLLRNHGAITFGSTVQEAWDLYVSLEAACNEQLRGPSSN
eukprot:TRINITY_DN66735_c0_g1_i1.p1 TRINITY_DN66735_c0_g1~~TRINITY_DN66735_c0_g1_i1.p1  ORF type:complete len:408 (+),score=103.02 TRINITY_DN66735_c0_g1_i1:47-1225(+)